LVWVAMEGRTGAQRPIWIPQTRVLVCRPANALLYCTEGCNGPVERVRAQ
jgi:hypothetical protein